MTTQKRKTLFGWFFFVGKDKLMFHCNDRRCVCLSFLLKFGMRISDTHRRVIWHELFKWFKCTNDSSISLWKTDTIDWFINEKEKRTLWWCWRWCRWRWWNGRWSSLLLLLIMINEWWRSRRDFLIAIFFCHISKWPDSTRFFSFDNFIFINFTFTIWKFPKSSNEKIELKKIF